MIDEPKKEETAEAPAPEPAAPAIDVDKEMQRLKSWEGRLKAKEAELAAKQSQEVAETPEAEMHEAEMGHMDGDEGGDPEMKALADDFGPEFVNMIKGFVAKEVNKSAADTFSKHSESIRQDVDAVISELTNEKQKAHFEKIADAHPDFMEVAESDPFKAWVAAQDPDKKAKTEATVNGGSAKEIIGMLKTFKAQVAESAPKPEPMMSDDDEMKASWDNAEGVRSTGLKLPEAPGSKDDFAAAWNEH